MRLVLLLLFVVPYSVNSFAAAEEPVFTKDIQSIFAEKCFNCHGPDKDEAGLQLHLSAKAIAELDSGEFAIVPGSPEKSTLIARVESRDESERMPPEGDPLTKEQISKIKDWIRSGAKYDQHWAYVPVKSPKLPVVKNSDWPRNEIDRFVLEKLIQNGISPSGIAPKAILIKRLYYDLIGLPPSPNEVDQFVESKDAEAYEKLVDKLLASKHFGERWGRHWLDKARYADSDGYEKDRPRPNAWRYRDWVIEAINRDMPFDQFTIEQLAGDLLPNATAMQKLATAFHRQTLTNTEGGTDQEQFRIEATFDRTETVGAIWMGLTLTCARCHTHKYDQITQREYYQTFAFFNSANETSTSVPTSLAALKRYQKQMDEYRIQMAKLENELSQAIQEMGPFVDQWIADKRAKIANEDPVKFHDVDVYRTQSTSGAKLDASDAAFVVTGNLKDKDKYTLFVNADLQKVSGIRLDVLSDGKLPGKGPGRAPNGNFVLSELRAYTSADKSFKKYQSIPLANAEANYSQNQFSPNGAISKKPKSGWAIAPKMGGSHWINFYFAKTVNLSGRQYMQIVLDQNYGGKHLIGKFRLRLMTGQNLLKALPADIVKVIQSRQTNNEQRKTVARFLSKSHHKTTKIWTEIEKLKKTEPKSPEMKVRVMGSAKRATKVLHRGDFLQPGDQVDAGAISVIGQTHTLNLRPEENSQPNRLAFAKWLVDPGHPLTSRVSVNHVWAHLFGRGIVGTQNDFGVRGESPTHPELLDWLAWKFSREMKWSRKALIKKICMSATYRQDSRYRQELLDKDPSNRLLARQNRVRVPAEIVRDLYLAASGLLSKKVGGPSVFPPLPSGVTDLSYANNFKWKTSQGEDRYRRGMYTFFKRTSPHPNLVGFDCPDSNTSKIKRDLSNTPIQALITLNNEVYVESAQAMAKRVIENSELTKDEDKLRFAMRLCISREPGRSDLERFLKLLKKFDRFYEQNKQLAKKITSRHASDQVPLHTNAAWVATLRMVMNLDEFIVRD